jgi:hypothetical protein
VSPRLFACLVGAIALIAGLIGLMADISTNDPREPQTLKCGNVFNHQANLDGMRQDDQLSSIFHNDTGHEAACKGAIRDREIWTIPLAVVGAVALLGAFAIRVKPSNPYDDLNVFTVTELVVITS